MLQFQCKNKNFFNDKSEAVRLFNHVTVDLTKLCIFLVFKMSNIAQISKELCPQTPKQSIRNKI